MASPARGVTKTIHTSNQRAFRELMLQARRNAGLTQRELAERLDKPQSFIAKYEGGERRLDVLEFVTIATVIGADPLRLLKGLLKSMAASR